ncbi:hypothetical protein yrohd0001_1090 [Yersinia rohdei ATCC 43380]|nr:hypothetical protein yrohd0001_1090 [Yersinia rohdei ATCC 43380]
MRGRHFLVVQRPEIALGKLCGECMWLPGKYSAYRFCWFFVFAGIYCAP